MHHSAKSSARGSLRWSTIPIPRSPPQLAARSRCIPSSLLLALLHLLRGLRVADALEALHPRHLAELGLAAVLRDALLAQLLGHLRAGLLLEHLRDVLADVFRGGRLQPTEPEDEDSEADRTKD